MKALIVPPLPAASRPSKTTTMRWPVSRNQRCTFDELELAGVEGLVVVVVVEPLAVGIARVEDVVLVGVLQRLADLLRRLLVGEAADRAVEGFLEAVVLGHRHLLGRCRRGHSSSQNRCPRAGGIAFAAGTGLRPASG